MKTVLIVAPHPDDETLGAGGTLLRHAASGDELHWLIVTTPGRLPGMASEEAIRREEQIEAVARAYDMAAVHRLDAAPTRLDALPLGELVAAATAVFQKVMPQVVYLPHPGDAHSDHRRSFEMCLSALKWFRSAGIEEAYAYETLSETGFDLGGGVPFRPTAYVDVSPHLDRKLEILESYSGELGAFPFPRSAEAVRALAALRGAESGCAAAEAFGVLRLRR